MGGAAVAQLGGYLQCPGLHPKVNWPRRLTAGLLRMIVLKDRGHPGVAIEGSEQAPFTVLDF